ncbi:MAG: hypothetical protein SGI92_07830 [Bryobacteraceae bacterium]|nr:hypothetical protein [Bryobacteraceae bacterium]
MRPLIDIHTHFFNANYWPIRGILRAWIGELPTVLLEGLVRAILWNTRESHELDVPVSELGPELLAHPEREATAMDAGPDRSARSTEAIIRSLVDALPDDLVLLPDPEMDRFIAEHSLATLVAPALAASQTAAMPLLERTVAISEGVSIRRLAIESALVHTIHESEAGLPDHRKRFITHFLHFLGQAQASEIELTEAYQAMVPSHLLLVHHMMDLDVPYRDHSVFDYGRQIRRMRKLSSLYPGKVLGFVAYDPYRGDLAGVQGALSGGFAGVKLYPPTGYRPIGNATPAMSRITRDIGGLDGTEMDRRLLAVYDFCLAPGAAPGIESGIPILFHCNDSGFERDSKMKVPEYCNEATTVEGTGNLSDPRALVDLFTRDGGKYAGLRICLGHAGGHQWTDEGASFDSSLCDIAKAKSFCHAVYLLCRRYEHVYCDFGHMVEVMHAPVADRLICRLVALASVDEPDSVNKYRFFDKVMFGSDYFMPNEYGTYKKYAQQMIHIFEQDGLTSVSDRFFMHNATRYLNLTGFLSRNPTLPHREKNELTRLAVP